MIPYIHARFPLRVSDWKAGHRPIDAARARALQAKLFDNPVISPERNVCNRLNGTYVHFGKEGEAAVAIERVIHPAGQRNKQVRLERINQEMAGLAARGGGKAGAAVPFGYEFVPFRYRFRSFFLEGISIKPIFVPDT